MNLHGGKLGLVHGIRPAALHSEFGNIVVFYKILIDQSHDFFKWEVIRRGRRPTAKIDIGRVEIKFFDHPAGGDNILSRAARYSAISAVWEDGRDKNEQ